jgi:hypothetical protein
MSMLWVRQADGRYRRTLFHLSVIPEAERQLIRAPGLSGPTSLILS